MVAALEGRNREAPANVPPTRIPPTMPHGTLRSTYRWLRWPVVGLALWLVAKSLGVHLERSHRREFLDALAIAPTRAAIASESALEARVRESVLPAVPLGSDTFAVIAYARRIDASKNVA